MSARLKWRGALASFVATAALAAFVVPAGAQAPSGEPIKIGFGMALTGPLAANGKQALLGMQDLGGGRSTAKGGLLGRPVKLVYYDDQIEPVDGAGHLHQAARRRQSRPRARPLCHQHDRAGDAGRDAEGQGCSSALFGLAREQRIQLSEIFRDDPVRPGHQAVLHRGLLRGRRGAEPEAADGGAGRGRRGILAATPARARARTPRSTASRSSTTRPTRPRPPTSPRSCARSRRPIRTSSSVCSYPLDSVGMVKAVNEVGFKPKMIGGAMVGLQATAFKNQLGPLLNGIVNYETWVPRRR